MKSFKSAKRTRSQTSNRKRTSALASVVPLGAALVPLAVMSWVLVETGTSLA